MGVAANPNLYVGPFQLKIFADLICKGLNVKMIP